jgi:hypothetical protein
MALFLKELADTAHAYGKKLYIDVPVDYEHIDDEGLYHGLNYPRLLGFADALIVWDYFYLEGRDPSTSEDVAKFFISRYDPAKIIFSVGLWGTASTVGPVEFADALRHELLGGARQIWITPNHLVSDAHWKEVVGLMSLR